MGELWNVAFLQPLLNGLILLSGVLFQNFGLTILVFTIIIRILILPLTLRQLQSTKAMSAMQPKLLELQKKYARDKQRLAAEQMKLYKEAGVNPVGCMWPMLVQFPIWIALYQAVIKALAATPEELRSLADVLYPFNLAAVPLRGEFLWLNLATPDPYLVLPVLTGGSLWVQQKMVAMPSLDPRQRSMNNMMLWMMPMMFTVFTLQFASGLAIYWVVSNIIGIVIQYFISGWGGLRPAPALPPGTETRLSHGRTGVQRQDRGGGRTAGPGRAGAEKGRGRDNRGAARKGRPSGPGSPGGPGAGPPPP